MNLKNILLILLLLQFSLAKDHFESFAKVPVAK